ncbi:hypothetical protein J2Y37_003203, partial [Prolinoborus sp. 3657]|nr:hypothetical protein [Prolinoborus sp. 3657]
MELFFKKSLIISIFCFSMHGYASTPTTMQKMTDDELAATEAQALMS